MSTVKARIRCFDGEEVVIDETKEVQVDSSWYTCQNFFDESQYKELMLKEYYTAVVIQWNYKNYVFKRKTDGDQRHEEGRA